MYVRNRNFDYAKILKKSINTCPKQRKVMHNQEVNNYIQFDFKNIVYASACIHIYFDYEDNMFINSLLYATISVWQESRSFSFKCRLPSYRCALLHRHTVPVRPNIYFILFCLFGNRLLLYNISIEIKKVLRRCMLKQ